MSEEENQENQAPQDPPQAEESASTQPESSGQAAATSVAREPRFENLTEDLSGKKDQKKVTFLYDIDLDVNIELGRADMKIRDILSLQPGSVVELNRLAGDPVDIIVNGCVLARGEVIVIDDNLLCV